VCSPRLSHVRSMSRKTGLFPPPSPTGALCPTLNRSSSQIAADLLQVAAGFPAVLLHIRKLLPAGGFRLSNVKRSCHSTSDHRNQRSVVPKSEHPRDDAGCFPRAISTTLCPRVSPSGFISLENRRFCASHLRRRSASFRKFAWLPEKNAVAPKGTNSGP